MKNFNTADLLTDRVNGWGVESIANKYQIGRDTVHLIFRDAGVLSRPCWTPERDQKLIELRASGLAFGKIGEELGCTRNAAIAQWHRIKAKTPVPEPPKVIAPLESIFDRQCVEPGCRLTAQPGRVICGDHITERYLTRVRDR